MAKVNLLMLNKSTKSVPSCSTEYVNYSLRSQNSLENNFLFRYWLPTRKLNQPFTYKKFNLNNFRCGRISNQPTHLKGVFKYFKITMYSKFSYSIYRTKRDYYEKLKISSLLYLKKLQTSRRRVGYRTSEGVKNTTQADHTLHPYFINFEFKLQQASWVWLGTPSSQHYIPGHVEPSVNMNDYRPNLDMINLISSRFFTLHDSYKSVSYPKNVQSAYALFDLLLSKTSTTSLCDGAEENTFEISDYKVYMQPLTTAYIKAKRWFYYRELRLMTRNLYRLCGQRPTAKIKFHHFSYPSLALLSMLSSATHKQVSEDVKNTKTLTFTHLITDCDTIPEEYEGSDGSEECEELEEHEEHEKREECEEQEEHEGLWGWSWETQLLLLATRTFLYKSLCLECKSRFYYLNLVSQLDSSSEIIENSDIVVDTCELAVKPEPFTFKYLVSKYGTTSQLVASNSFLNDTVSRYLLMHLYTFRSLNQLIQESTTTSNLPPEVKFKNLVNKRFRQFTNKQLPQKFFRKRPSVKQVREVFDKDHIYLKNNKRDKRDILYATHVVRRLRFSQLQAKEGVKKINYGRIRLVLEQFVSRLQTSQPGTLKYYKKTPLQLLPALAPFTLTHQLEDVQNIGNLASADTDVLSVLFFYTVRRYLLRVFNTNTRAQLPEYEQTSAELPTKVVQLLLQTNKARNLLIHKSKTWYQSYDNKKSAVLSNNSTLTSDYLYFDEDDCFTPEVEPDSLLESMPVSLDPVPQNLVTNSNQALIWLTSTVTRLAPFLPTAAQINPLTLRLRSGYRKPTLNILLGGCTKEWSFIKRLAVIFRSQLDSSLEDSEQSWTSEYYNLKRLAFTTSTSLAFVLNTSSFYYVFLTLTKHLSPLEALRRHRIQIYSFSDDIKVKKSMIKRYTKRPDYDLNLGRLTTMYQTFGFSMNATSASSTTPRNYSLNYLPMESLFDKSEELPKSQRIRFKPGYSRLWRRARASFKVVFFFRFRYQHRLTSYVMQHEYLQTNSQANPVNKIVNQENLIFILLMRCKFATDYVWSFELIQNNYVFVNGFTVTNPNTSLAKGDFLQLLVHIKYYITLKWQKSLIFDKKVRLFKFVKRKFKPKTQRMGANRNYRYPDWLLKLRFYSGSVPKIFELDFFTLSGFMIHNPFMSTHFDTDERDLAWPKVLRLYNWKYIN